MPWLAAYIETLEAEPEDFYFRDWVIIPPLCPTPLSSYELIACDPEFVRGVE